MIEGYCIGCTQTKDIVHITRWDTPKIAGLCINCVGPPEPRSFRTEKRISRLTEKILYG